MSGDPFIRHDDSEIVDVKHCPLLNRPCMQTRCQWWVVDFMEDKARHRMNCAVHMIAVGVTDETLLALGAKR